MGKYKESPRYNVVSIRVNDQEKAAMNEYMRHSHKSISTLLRDAIQIYISQPLRTDNRE